VQLGDGDDDPPPGGNFPGGNVACRRAFLSLSSPPPGAAEMVSGQRPIFRSSRGRSTRRGAPSGGPGRPHRLLARRPWEPRRKAVWAL
jgi:hypothetical protein